MRASLALAVVCTGCTLLVSIDDGLSAGAKTSSVATDAGTTTTANDAGTRSDASKPPAPDAAVASRYRAAVLLDEPALYLRFGEAPQTASVRSEVGALTASYPTAGAARGIAGALAGDPDTALTFDDATLDMPAGLELAGDDSESSIELWLRVEKHQQGYNWILDHQLWDGLRRGWDLQISDGFLTYERWDGTGASSSVSAQEALTIGKWHHVVAQRDKAGQRIFLDGVLRENHGESTVIPKTGSGWTIGSNSCFSCGDRQNYEGAIDELAIYTHRLTPERITAHLAAAK